MSVHDETIEVHKVPIFLDDHEEMQVAIVLINREFIEDFNSGAPLKTHFHMCPEHGRELDHYSLPSVDNRQIKLKVGKPRT